MATPPPPPPSSSRAAARCAGHHGRRQWRPHATAYGRSVRSALPLFEEFPMKNGHVNGKIIGNYGEIPIRNGGLSGKNIERTGYHPTIALDFFYMWMDHHLLWVP